MRPLARVRSRLLLAAAFAVIMLAAFVVAPSDAEASHTQRNPKPVPVRIKLDDTFGPNQVVVPPLSLQGNPISTETKTLKIRGYVDGNATIRLLAGQVTINFTSANLTIDPIVLDDSSCPVVRTTPITVRLDPSRPSSASADIFKGTVSMNLNALVRASLVSDGSPCGQPVITGPYVENPLSQSTSGGSFKLRIGVREGRVMLGIVKGEATAPNTVLSACLAEGPPDSPCPPGGAMSLDPVTLTVRLAGWIGLR